MFLKFNSLKKCILHIGGVCSLKSKEEEDEDFRKDNKPTTVKAFLFPKDLFSNLLNLLGDGIPNLQYAKYQI
jgi:hypothetical protein